jgi:hypothetical protein
MLRQLFRRKYELQQLLPHLVILGGALQRVEVVVPGPLSVLVRGVQVGQDVLHVGNIGFGQLCQWKPGRKIRTIY